MNIFVLDLNCIKCAVYHCDKHVVKLILESAQLLCTTARVHGINYGYKACYVNHACRKWLDESIENDKWLLQLASELCCEYTYRFGKKHKTEEILLNFPISYLKIMLPDVPMTPRPLCMPDDCKIENDPVSSYRNYYLKYKKHLLKYTRREVPEWIKEINYAGI